MSLRRKKHQDFFCHSKVWLENSLPHLHWQMLGVAAEKIVFGSASK
jgi:hypothetical protein